ncbi:MAG: hypothetical protein DRO90_03245 [Candidatus Altiarchaeales archaeon]|nr:MAG: hypothetical protein DRO95_00560 [Candidatus Altiarchaeales archaeon]RLI93684.1 MAG: hypothetical protein DRO90_03245 [Candidatus Altiarchaeales archaeon]RLI95073.1 MAG: hypothetical protein DRO94_01335 [Candidatus Altiarchaeales archaeon]HDO82190.1 hypothetical protein [Candidatus Altiarchaeales archaeon]HEX54839.1 hypothetical protein [Candidatus Altiarchaeales archaeon]
MSDSVLITLGPTREFIDPVRYITNASSGKMGKCIAEEALSRGYEVTIISGPVNIELPESARLINVTTAMEMINSTLSELENGYKILVSTAAIADYSPEFRAEKIKSDKNELNIRLRLNPKLTKLARKRFPELFIVAFKAEYNMPEEKLIEIAEKKLIDENLNIVVANDISKNKFGSDYSDAYIINENEKIYIEKCSKREISRRIWDIIEMKLKE